MGEYTVYMHVFPNGKKYVGITSQDVSRRWRDGEGYEGQVVYGAILKYGWNNVKARRVHRDWQGVPERSASPARNWDLLKDDKLCCQSRQAV